MRYDVRELTAMARDGSFYTIEPLELQPSGASNTSAQGTLSLAVGWVAPSEDELAKIAAAQPKKAKSSLFGGMLPGGKKDVAESAPPPKGAGAPGGPAKTAPGGVKHPEKLGELCIVLLRASGLAAGCM